MIYQVYITADRWTTPLELFPVAAAVVSRAGRLASYLLFVSGTFVVCIYSGAFVGRRLGLCGCQDWGGLSYYTS